MESTSASSRFAPSRMDRCSSLAAFTPEKGAAEAIEVARRCGRRLVIAGIIQDQGYFDREVAPHIDGDRVRYLGSVGPRERCEVLGRADALLHPINFDEPFGVSMVEAMACGVPVIAIGRGSVPEVVVDGRTGFIVADVEEATAAVQRLGQLDRSASRQHVEDRFSIERMTDGYLGVYREVLRRSRSRSQSDERDEREEANDS